MLFALKYQYKHNRRCFVTCIVLTGRGASNQIINDFQIGTLNLAVAARALNKPMYAMAESIKFVKEYPLSQKDIPDSYKVCITSVLQMEMHVFSTVPHCWLWAARCMMNTLSSTTQHPSMSN